MRAPPGRHMTWPTRDKLMPRVTCIGAESRLLCIVKPSRGVRVHCPGAATAWETSTPVTSAPMPHHQLLSSHLPTTSHLSPPNSRFVQGGATADPWKSASAITAQTGTGASSNLAGLPTFAYTASTPTQQLIAGLGTATRPPTSSTAPDLPESRVGSTPPICCLLILLRCTLLPAALLFLLFPL